MIRRFYPHLLTITAMGIFSLSTPAFGGKLLVNNDEWAFTNYGYERAGEANAEQFVRNVAEYLTGGSGDVLIYSSDHGLTESRFLASLAEAGYGVTVDNTGATSFDLATLQQYKAVYLGGHGLSKNDAVLASYVNNGGSVFLALGTAVMDAAEEALLWNSFLNSFGLNAASTYSQFEGTYAPTGSHPIFNGVDQIYYYDGNSVTLTSSLTNPNTRILETSAEGFGLFGLYDDSVRNTHMPEPQTMTLLAAGLGVVAWARRRRRMA